MLQSATQLLPKTRFDTAVAIALIALAALTGLLIARGDQIGVQLTSVSPAPNAALVSALAPIEITFDQTVVLPDELLPLTIEPPVEGTTRWEQSTLVFTPDQPLQAGQTYSIEVDDRITGVQGRPIKGELAWEFTIREPQVLYVTLDDNDKDQLFLTSADGSDNSVLTSEPFGISDYSVAPNGTSVVFAALREDQGSDLWALDVTSGEKSLLLDCPGAVCNQAVWHPDGRRIVYERRNFITDDSAPGPPRLWWLNPATSETVPVFEDQQQIGYGASWSRTGQWLGYVSPATQGIQMFNINTGQNVLVPSRMGGLPVWHPTENSILITDIQPGDEGFAVHLLQATPEQGGLVDLSEGDGAVEDSSPRWSPDGQQLVFTRKVAGAAMGKQVWLMNSDGSNAQFITNDTQIHHGLPRWSPNGRQIIFQRFPLQELGALPSIWLYNLDTGNSQELVGRGNRPTWLP